MKIEINYTHHYKNHASILIWQHTKVHRHATVLLRHYERKKVRYQGVAYSSRDETLVNNDEDKNNGSQELKKKPQNFDVAQEKRKETKNFDVQEDIDASIFEIAFPTLATLAADPLASLISTAWVGQLGAVELAGVGVAISVYNTFTKLLNMPLLAVVTTGTATAIGKSGNSGEKSTAVQNAIGSSLLLSCFMGILQSVLLIFLGLPGLGLWGAGESSPLHLSASSYLFWRSISAPASVLLLALQGTFRGLGDTKAPLLATVFSNFINIILEPIFIFKFGWGVKGAAGAIIVAQLASMLGLITMLRQRGIEIGKMRFSSIKDSWEYLKPTGLLTLRTISITATYAVATGIASRVDPSYAAAHQIAFQIWLAASLLADSLAVAAQSLIARLLAQNTKDARKEAECVVNRVIKWSIVLGMSLMFILFCITVILPFSKLFSSDPAVLTALNSIIPAVILTQPINAIAFVLDGVLYGVNGFRYAAISMLIAALPSIGVMVTGSWIVATMNLGPAVKLAAVWGGLATVMFLRFLTIFRPLITRRPPFDQLGQECVQRR